MRTINRETQKANLHVWILKAVDNRLTEAATLLGRTKGNLVENAVFEYLNGLQPAIDQLKKERAD